LPWYSLLIDDAPRQEKGKMLMFLLCAVSFGIPAAAIVLQISQDKRAKQKDAKKMGLTRK
jgi:hypothetical protein